VDILSCPHCDRVFRAKAAVLGKTIRCRGCCGPFYVPRDPSTAPTARPPTDGGSHAPASTPLALAGTVGGRPVWSCPSCTRTFAMHPRFAGKSIRCRGCRCSFYVPAGTLDQAAAPMRPVPSNGATATKESHNASTASNRATKAPPPVPRAEPGAAAVSDDVGDVVDHPSRGMAVPSAVRPASDRQSSNSTADLIAIVLGGACALPVTQLILWWVFHQDPFSIAKRLPQPWRWIAPEHLEEPR